MSRMYQRYCTMSAISLFRTPSCQAGVSGCRQLFCARDGGQITQPIRGSTYIAASWANRHVRGLASEAVARAAQDEIPLAVGPLYDAKLPIGQRAKQKQQDKEFFADLLSSAATKRDAKAYISRLKSPTKLKPVREKTSESGIPVNLGNLFGRARAIESSPVFTQHELEEKGFQEQETLHVALVKISDIDQMSDTLVQGIAQTLSQLARLSMGPCVVLHTSNPSRDEIRRSLAEQSERLARAIDSVSESGARMLDNIITVGESGKPEVCMQKLLMRPLRHGNIPIVLPVAYSEQQQQAITLSGDQAVLALTKNFAGLRTGGDRVTSPKVASLDRIIIIDDAGGMPNPSSTDGKHVFINLMQEYTSLQKELSSTQTSSRHLSNLSLLKDALDMLPSTSSGLMTTPSEASNFPQPEAAPTGPTVGTRRQKNALIHNLLTDKPAFSSSLPRTRLTRSTQDAASLEVSTFVKRGMPVSIFPDPFVQPWTADSPRIKLTDPQIDLKKLVYLIDDSFNRKLDIDHYLDRVNEKLAGVIIAGDYEGGAILTWETPAGADPSDVSRLVPYLDKFAVLKKSQGAGGVADIVFNSMVRTCFPRGVCWRSRKDNPVNKWYFERSRGTWKIPDMNWTSFWTTPGVAQSSQLFHDYESVCRAVQPSWADKKKAAD